MVFVGVLIIAALWAPCNGQPLSYILADTAFLADPVSAAANGDLAWSRHVSHYLWHVQRTLGLEAIPSGNWSRHKRELPTDPLTTLIKDPQGVFLLKSLEPRFNIPAKFPNDVVLFSRSEAGVSAWYAAALEADGESPQTAFANTLVLYKLLGNRFLEQTRSAVYGAKSLTVQEIDGWTYIVAAEGLAHYQRHSPEAGSTLYRLSRNGRQLVKVETLETLDPSDIVSWEFHGSHYLAVTSGFTNNSGVISYSAETRVFKWLGEHMDIIQRLPSTGSVAVTAFAIESKQYLAVINHINDQGETNIDSTIYRFDMVKEKFVFHQSLHTHAAVDVSFFSMPRSKGYDHFVVVANSFYQGPDNRRNPETTSVIYKWVEGYFEAFQSLPLVGASQWTSYLGPQGETVLLGASAYGLHAYQYDGWRFQRVYITGEPLLVGPGHKIASLRSVVFGSEGLVVISSKQNAGLLTNIFSLKFEKSSPLEGLYQDLKQWCSGQLQRLQRSTSTISSLLERVRAAPKWDSPSMVVESLTFESNSTIKALSADAIKTNTDVEINVKVLEDVDSLWKMMRNTESQLSVARSNVATALRKSTGNIVHGRVVIDNASLNCNDGCHFSNATALHLNDEPVDSFVRNIVRLDSKIVVDSLHLSKVVVPGNLVSSRVLGVNEPLVNRKHTKRISSGLSVDELHIDLGLDVRGKIDGLRIHPNSLLLVDGDQTLSGFSCTSHWQVRHLVLNGRVNGMSVDVSKAELPREIEVFIKTSPPSSLSVLNVNLVGRLGEVLMDDLTRRALRTQGTQTVTGRHSFSQISVVETKARTVPIENVIRIDHGADVIPGPVSFSQTLRAEQVRVMERLNHVQVASDWSMDLLLARGMPSGQIVSGYKWIRAVSVSKVGRVHGRVLGLELPPAHEDLKIVEDDVLLEGNITIAGRVAISGTLSADDLSDPATGLTLLSVLRDAVLLEDPVPSSVVIEDVHVVSDTRPTSLCVRAGDCVDTSVWIENSPGAEVFVTEPAYFSGDLSITQSSTLHGTVNAVHLPTLEQTSLHTIGYQEIIGFKTFAAIKTPTTQSKDTLLGESRWRWLDVWSRHHRQQAMDRIKFENDLEVDGELDLKRLYLEGKLGEMNVSATLNDSIFEDASGVVVIDGPKSFTQTIEVDNLQVESKAGGTDLSRLHGVTTSQDEAVFQFPGVAIRKPLFVSRLSYHGTLDGMSDAEWSAPWLEVDGDQTLMEPQTVAGTVDALSGVYVSSTVNNVGLQDFARQVARINGTDLHLGSVQFGDLVTANGDVISGTFGGELLSEALLSRGALAQELHGRLHFNGGLEAAELKMMGDLAGENFNHLCSFAYPPLSSLKAPQHLTVRGDLLMEEEPVLHQDLNGHSMQKLLNNTWLRDRSAQIFGELDFDDVQFHSDVTVHGSIDGVMLDAIAARYVSLSGDGTISTSLSITGGVTVEGKLVSGGAVEVDGSVGGQFLRHFVDEVLLDGPDQDVSARFEFETVSATGDVQLNGTINGLDLATDVVLTKATFIEAVNHNKVTERKSVRGAHVTDLGLEDGVRVQGVDLSLWDKNAVRVRGDFNVTGSKTLYGPQVSTSMTVEGLVSGVKVSASELLLRHSNQMVLGSKIFRPSTLPGFGLRVQNLDLLGRLNGVDMRALLSNQAYWSTDVEVQTPVVMTAPLLVEQAIVDKLYQGTAVADLIHEANNPPVLDEYPARHESLLLSAERIQRSLKAQGYYLNYFHTAATLSASVRAVVPLGCGDDPAYTIAVVTEADPGRNLDVKFFNWDASSGTIAEHPTLSHVSLPANVRIVAPAQYAGVNALYWENSDALGVNHGDVIGLLRNGTLGHAKLLQDALPSSWVAVTMVGDMSCLIRGSYGNEDGVGSFCDLQCTGSSRDDVIRQALPASRPMHAASLTVQGVAQVFVASGASEVSEGGVDVWRWQGGRLHKVQTLGVVNATAVAAVEHRGVQYLATASGHILDAPHAGLVHISRYDNSRWSHWVSLEVEGPRGLQFSNLPSGELVLYVSTSCPTDSLVVLVYRGVSGFVRQTSAAVPLHSTLRAFTTRDHQHIVAVSGGPQAALLQTAFKGSWIGAGGE